MILKPCRQLLCLYFIFFNLNSWCLIIYTMPLEVQRSHCSFWILRNLWNRRTSNLTGNRLISYSKGVNLLKCFNLFLSIYIGNNWYIFLLIFINLYYIFIFINICLFSDSCHTFMTNTGRWSVFIFLYILNIFKRPNILNTININLLFYNFTAK